MQRLTFLIGLLFAVLMQMPAQAAVIPALTLTQSTQWPLSGHLGYWRDPTGKATIEDVVAKPEAAFTYVKDRLSLGFTADAVWLKFTLDVGVPPPRATDLWLELSQGIMEDARLFVPLPDGRYVEAGFESTTQSSAHRLAHRLPLFELPSVSRRASATYFLRLSTSSSMSTHLTLWEPRALMRASSTEGFVWGWVFGSYMLVVFFYFFFWLWTREPIHLLYTSYVAINCLAAIFTGGWPAQLLPDVSMAVWLKWLGIWISLSVVVGVWFTAKFLRLGERWPRFVKTILTIVTGVCVVGIVGVLMGHYRVVIPPIQLTSVSTIVLTLFLGLYLAREGHRGAKFFLFAFSFFYVGVMWRYLRNFGLLEPSFWNDNSYQVGRFIHMLVMSTGIFASYSRLRRDKQIAEARAATEARLREEQRDFVSMVSHELRTPLSIIGASSDNMAQDPGLNDKSRQRVNKIIKSTERMTQLMDNYLSKERMLLDRQQLQVGQVDLVALCQQVLEELDDNHDVSVEVRTSRAQVMVYCDASLIKIALHNLVNNARRHSPPGAQVLIVLETHWRSVEIWVRDEGNGIPDDEIAHIFTRFYRGRGALDQPGAGLGLYLVRTIAERHGGWVMAKNRPGRGCEFRMQLPT